MKFILCCSTTTIPTDVRVSGKAREVYKECPTLRKRLGKMLQKLLSPCKEKWTQKRVRSWGERISSNIMVSFLSSTSWWGIEKINNLEIFLCIWALIMKILNVFQPITSYKRIGEASIVPRLSRRAGSLLSPPLVQPIIYKILTHSSDIVFECIFSGTLIENHIVEKWHSQFCNQFLFTTSKPYILEAEIIKLAEM